MGYDFTARMEESLDDVAEGEVPWKEVLDRFYADFKQKLEAAGSSEEGKGMRANQPTPTDIPCVECGRPMMIRTASTGVFLGCSGYALPPKERCKATVKDRKSTRLNSSHVKTSYAVFCLKKIKD